VAIKDGGHPDLACGDEVYVYQHDRHTVRDTGDLDTEQLDHYHGVSDCGDCPTVGESIMTIKLYAE